jgi:hypothetical protein
VRIDAEIGADGEIRGELKVSEPVAVVDPLPLLPQPADDLGILRAFPGRPDSGEMSFVALPADPRTFAFTTRLPRRFGDVGALPGRGAWANGAWYPTPLLVDGDRTTVAIADWDVTLRARPNVGPSVLVVSGVAAAGEIEIPPRVTWTGRADRVPIALVLGGRIESRRAGMGEVRFVERGPREAHAHHELTRILETEWPLALPADVTVVECFDRERLARSAPGMVYLADRAFRVFPGLDRFHRPAVRRAMLAEASGAPDAWTREFVGTAIDAPLPAPSVRKFLGILAWNPIIDQVLNDGTLPYYTDAFGEAHAEPRDWADALRGTIPARAAALQAAALVGADAVQRVGGDVAGGVDLADAAARANLPPELVAGWERAYPGDQELRASREGVRREAPADAPPEVIEVRVDGKSEARLAIGRVQDWSFPGARRVHVDPRALVSASERADDRWPARYTAIATGWFGDISLTQGTFGLGGQLAVRRTDDTRGMVLAGIAHDVQDLVSFSAGYVRWLGPLVDRQRRVHRVYVLGGPSLLDPAFRPTTAGAVAVGGTVAYAWDTREDDTYALSGHRLSVAGGGGYVPGSAETWANAAAGAVGLWPISPRVVVAVRGRGGWASGDVEHRLLPLGGAAAVRAIPAGAMIGNERGIASAELRLAPLRHADIPLGLGWLDEIQLVPGVDAGLAARDGIAGASAAVGANLGIYGVVDVLGARPTLLGVSLAYPLVAEQVAPAGLQVYFEFDHAF